MLYLFNVTSIRVLGILDLLNLYVIRRTIYISGIKPYLSKSVQNEALEVKIICFCSSMFHRSFSVAIKNVKCVRPCSSMMYLLYLPNVFVELCR
jgi:hypothetical protein